MPRRRTSKRQSSRLHSLCIYRTASRDRVARGPSTTCNCTKYGEEHGETISPGTSAWSDPPSPHDIISEAVVQMIDRTTKTSLEGGAALHLAMENGCTSVFRLRGTSLARRCRGNRHRIPCRNLTTDQLFVVDEVGVYWVGHHRQEQTFGGDHHVVPLAQCGDDEDSWTEFLDAVRRTRVYDVMIKLRRNDLRTALWLSRKARNGEYRFLQFAENHPELATQILPHPDEGQKWSIQQFQKAWKLVARNKRPREIAKWTTLGPTYAKAPKERTSDVASGILARDLLAREHHDLFCAWNAFAPTHVKDVLWRNPEVIVEVVCREMSPSNWGSPRWIPASLLVRSMLNSGLDAVARANRLTPNPLDGMSDAVDDLLTRIFVPQLLMSGYDDFPHNAPAVAAALVKLWLMLRFGTPAERQETARRLPDAAREAKRCRSVRPRWKDFLRWNSLHHEPCRLARALSVATGGDWPEVYEGRLATPLVMDAGRRLGEWMRRIENISELVILAREEQHCIASFEFTLRQGEFHCFVIEDELGRSTVLAKEHARWQCREGKSALVLQKHDAYRVSQCRMRRNAPSPPAHFRRAQAMIDTWCQLAASKGSIQASAREMRIRSTSSWTTPKITPERMEQYWKEVSRDCVPAWLFDFDPAKELMRRLFCEYVHVGEGSEVDDCGRQLSAT